MKYLVLLLLLLGCDEAGQDHIADSSTYIPEVGLNIPDAIRDAGQDSSSDLLLPPAVWDAQPPPPDQEVDAATICSPYGSHENCDIPQLEGVCAHGERLCQGTSWTSCLQVNNPRHEVCNGLDDNCNGFIDEAPTDPTGQTTLHRACYTGPDSTLKVGTCIGGISYCRERQVDTDGGVQSEFLYGSCERQILPTDEICDNFDNDCDGQTDETVTNACGECGDVPEEICDGIDNNCDGIIDENLLNACGECGELSAELCDFIDNDCDGITDEDAGNCECGNPLYVPQPEICNGADEDCDGQIDEGPDGGPLALLCSTDIVTGQIMTYERQEDGPQYVGGDCRLGLSFCEESIDGQGQPEYSYLECLQEIQPKIERCNGVDDDCDGIADEGFEAARVAVLMVIDVSGSMQPNELATAFDATRNTVRAIHNGGPVDICYMLAVVGSNSYPDPFLFAPAHNCVPGIEDPRQLPIEDLETAIIDLRTSLRTGQLNQGGATENTLDAIGMFFTDDLIDWDGDGILDDVLWDTSDLLSPQHSIDLSQYTHRLIVVLGDEEAQGVEWDEHSAFRAMGQVSGMLFIIGPNISTGVGRRVRDSYGQLIDIGAVYHSMGEIRHDLNNDEQEIADGIREALEEADCINNQQEEP